MVRQSSSGVTYSSPYYDVFSIRSPVFPAKSIGYVILPCSVSTSVPLEFLVLSRAGGGYDRQFYENEDRKSHFGFLLNLMAVKRKWEIKEGVVKEGGMKEGEVKEEEGLIGAGGKREEEVEEDARERYGIGVIFEGAGPKESEVKVVKLQ